MTYWHSLGIIVLIGVLTFVVLAFLVDKDELER